MRRSLLALATSVTLLTLVGCGSSSESAPPATAGAASPAPVASAAAPAAPAAPSVSALTKAEFIDQGDAVCAAFAEASSAIPAPADQSGLGPYLSEFVALLESTRADFAELAPPADGAAVQAALLAALDTSRSTLQGAVAATGSGDVVGAGDLAARAGEEVTAGNAAAADYGFVDCSKDS